MKNKFEEAKQEKNEDVSRQESKWGCVWVALIGHIIQEKAKTLSTMMGKAGLKPVFDGWKSGKIGMVYIKWICMGKIYLWTPLLLRILKEKWRIFATIDQRSDL